MQSNQERMQAERELVSFLRAYCALISAHISGIRSLMSGTTEQVMNSVMQISDAREAKKKLADTVLVKRREGESISRTFQGDDATFKNAEVNRSDSGTSHLTAAARLKTYMGSFDDLDQSMQDTLFNIIGAISADDVVGQRLEHVCTALGNLEVGLSRMLSHEGKLIPEEQIKKLFAEILRVTRKSYTMPDEHKILDAVFGKSG